MNANKEEKKDLFELAETCIKENKFEGKLEIQGGT